MVPKWLWWVAILLNVVLAVAFAIVHLYEMENNFCDPVHGCVSERLSAPIGGSLATLLALLGLAVGMALRRRVPPAAFVVPPLLASLFASLIIVAQLDPWIVPLWWPLLVLSLLDAALLIVASFGREERKPAAAKTDPPPTLIR
jgi:hypothetical protein